MTKEPARPPASRACRLLNKLVEAAWFDLDEIAEELVVSRRTLQGFLDGTIPIPPDRQLCLGLFVAQNVPPFARDGHQLCGQARAAISYNGHETETHSTQPPRAGW